MLSLLLLGVFLRPFISSYAFPLANNLYSYGLLFCLAAWIYSKRLNLPDIKPTLYPLALLLLAVFTRVIIQAPKDTGLERIILLLTAALIFIASGCFSKEEREKTLQVIVISATAVSLYALYQYFWRFPHLIAFIKTHAISDPYILQCLEQKRVFGPFVTPATLGGFLIMAIPLFFINRGTMRLAIVPLLALILTQSLGAFVSLILALFFYYLLRKGGSKSVYLALGLTLVFLIILAVRIFPSYQHFHPSFSIKMRLSYWQDTLRLIALHPFIGIGMGDFHLAASRFAHNSYLQLWAEGGILPLLAFLWLVFNIFTNGLRKIILGQEQKPELLLLLCASAAFLLHNLVDFTFFLPEASWIWWLITGMAYFWRDS